METDEREFLEKHVQHRYYVHFFVTKLIEELLLRANLHDISKLTSEEFDGFAKSIYYLKGPWGQEARPPEILKRLKQSLVTHYAYNDHHPEYFQNGMKDMDLIQMLELIVDWRAAMIGQGNHDIEETLRVGQERFKYPDYVKDILRNTFKTIQKYELEADLYLPQIE